MKDLVPEISLEEFRAQVETVTTIEHCPSAIAIEKNIPIYDGARVSAEISREWARVIGEGVDLGVEVEVGRDEGRMVTGVRGLDHALDDDGGIRLHFSMGPEL